MKKIFTLMTLALVAMGMNAQEKVLFQNGNTYGNGATLTSESTTLVLGNDRAKKNYDLKLASVKTYLAELLGQQVMVENSETGEMEEKTRVVYVVGANNPKDAPLGDDDKSAGGGYSAAKANLPQSGTYYMITPTKNGHVTAFIILNGAKSFYVVKASDGSCLAPGEISIKADGDEPTEMPLADDYTVSEKVTGTAEFDVKAGETYYVFCTGSKLSFGGYVFTPSGDDQPGDFTETTLWEGNAVINGWSDQPTFLSDGGTELKNANAKAGDRVRFYMTAPDTKWQVELTEGHWGGMYVRWSEEPLFNEDGSARESVIVNLSSTGYAEIELTDAILEAAYTVKYWGGVFLLNGDGNLVCTKVTLVQEGGVAPQPQGEKVSIIDKFTGNWADAESNTHNEDGSVTYNGKQWGGLSAWMAENDVPADWSMYSKLVFEFAQPTTIACQGFVQCADPEDPTDGNKNVSNTWWGNAGINKLECSFEGLDMSRVRQACLQAADEGVFYISEIYLVTNANGIQETVAVGHKVNANAPIYNLAGVRVNKDYKGIVIQNGRKFVQK